MDDSSNKKKNDYDPNWLKGTSAEKLLKYESSSEKNFSHPVFKKLSKMNGKINDMSLDSLIDSLNDLKLDSRFFLCFYLFKKKAYSTCF